MMNRNFQDLAMGSRKRGSRTVMRASTGGGMPDPDDDEKNKKAPWQRGIETFVYFNGNPLLNLLPFLPKQKPTVARPELLDSKGLFKNESVLLTYDKSNFDLIWKVLDDVVMGGKSESSAKVKEDKDGNYVSFSGLTNTQGGGFCSIRTKNFKPAFDLSDYGGLTFRVRSAKNFKYKFNLRDEEDWDAVAWQCEFEVPGGNKWTEIKLPFKKFEPVKRANKFSDPQFRKINLENILSFQILLSKFKYVSFGEGETVLNDKFEEGEFSIDFGKIRAYK